MVPTRPPVAPRTVVGVAVAVGVVAAAATVAVGVTGSPLLAPFARVLVGVLTLVGVPVLLLVRRVPGEPLPGVRAAGLTVGLLSGVGGLLIGVQQLLTAGPLAYPSLGDLLGLTAAPFAVLTVFRVPRAGGDAVRLTRLLPVALFVASAMTLAVWRAARVSGVAPSASVVAASVMMVVVGSIITLLVAVAVIGHERAMTLLVLSGCLFLVGCSVIAAQAMVPDVRTALVSDVALCLCWPLLWAGLLLTPTSVPPLEPAGLAAAEHRATLVTVVAICGAAVLVVLALMTGTNDLLGMVLLACVALGVVLHVVGTQRQHLVQVRGLLHLADHDPMTGAGNRRALSAVLSAVGRTGGPVAVAVVNLDGFSAVNDRFGDRGGDAVLVAVAGALAGAVPDGVEVFRLGGDEFALVGPLDGAGMLAVAATARAATASAAAEVPGMGQVRLASSCGVHSVPACAHGHAGPPMTPIGLASAALQAARRAGGDRVVEWSEDLAADERRREFVETRLRHALVDGGVEVHLQPVVDVATGAVLGFEALSRWTDAELGPVSPVEFVAVAEASGLVVALGRQVMADALTALVTTGALVRGMGVAVNASPVELRLEGFVASVADALATHGVPADLLVVEVTEAIFVSADDPAVAALDELATMGVSVAVDDFGTGYSSLSYLTRLPVHELKIDRSLTSRLHEGPTRAVVTALVAMADALGLEVVAEGVEETAQADALAAMGVTRGQGWLWWKALLVDQVTALLAEQERPCPGSGALLAAEVAEGAP